MFHKQEFVQTMYTFVSISGNVEIIIDFIDFQQWISNHLVVFKGAHSVHMIHHEMLSLIR